MSAYTETMRRWASDTRRAGSLPEADGTGEVGLGEEEAGRRLAVRFAIRVREGRTEQVRYQVFGCGFSMAACAAAAHLAEGRTLEDARAIGAAEIEALLGGLPPERIYCAELAEKALKGAVDAALEGSGSTRSVLRPGGEDPPPPTNDGDPLYRSLMGSPSPANVSREDRHLFACLLATAAREEHGIDRSLGLSPDDLPLLLAHLFPASGPEALPLQSGDAELPSAGANPEILSIILPHVPRDASGRELPLSGWLARAVAARAARPGHLWVSMGLFERPELSAAIRRHLPSLAEANSQGMRWKRFLYKELCRQQGGSLCKAPDCRDCSDYALCFGEG